MTEWCHRCEADLPREAGTGGRTLPFCPHCGAPQLRLVGEPAPATAPVSTGLLPPPDPRAVDWPLALRGAGLVAAVGCGLMVVGVFSAVVSLLAVLWILSCGVLVLLLYARRRPAAWMDQRTGLRVGLVAGLVMVCALMLVGAGAGVTKRFALKDMGDFDKEYAERTQQRNAWFAGVMKEQGQSEEAQKESMELLTSPLMSSPEMRAGVTLLGVGMYGGLLLALTAGSGALTGALRKRSRELLRDGRLG